MKEFLTFFVCLLVIYSPCDSFYRKGRKHKGLGSPFVENFVKLPPDEWFDQKLDHFDPMNNVTWKQVIIPLKEDDFYLIYIPVGCLT